jgi:hypothetical protein
MSTIAVFMALGGGAYAVSGTADDPPRADSAQIPTRGGTIIGCYNRRTGTLRVVRSSRRCRRSRERVLRWAQRGRPGTPADTSAFYTKGETDQRFLPLTGTAANASQLQGLAPSAFEGAEAVVAGKGNQTSSTTQTLLAVQSMGFKVLTDGDSDADGSLRVENIKAGGTLTALSAISPDQVIAAGATSPEMAPGRYDDGDTDYWERLILDNESGRSALVRCYWDANEANCFVTAG